MNRASRRSAESKTTPVAIRFNCPGLDGQGCPEADSMVSLLSGYRQSFTVSDVQRWCEKSGWTLAVARMDETTPLVEPMCSRCAKRLAERILAEAGGEGEPGALAGLAKLIVLGEDQ